MPVLYQMAYCLAAVMLLKSIRKEIIENHQLQAVISMPSGVFKPYAGVSTAVLVFTKDRSWWDGKMSGFMT